MKPIYDAIFGRPAPIELCRAFQVPAKRVLLLRSAGVFAVLTHLPCPGPVFVFPRDRSPPSPKNLPALQPSINILRRVVVLRQQSSPLSRPRLRLVRRISNPGSMVSQRWFKQAEVLGLGFAHDRTPVDKNVTAWRCAMPPTSRSTRNLPRAAIRDADFVAWDRRSPATSRASVFESVFHFRPGSG